MIYFVRKRDIRLAWLKLQHRIMAAHLSASVVGAQAVPLFVAWIGLLKHLFF